YASNVILAYNPMTKCIDAPTTLYWAHLVVLLSFL
ncbi:MAG: hypothetical protein ACJA0G_002579, partial [Kangiellaceae bacterium]